jgi:hypothetical protein
VFSATLDVFAGCIVDLQAVFKTVIVGRRWSLVRGIWVCDKLAISAYTCFSSFPVVADTEVGEL